MNDDIKTPEELLDWLIENQEKLLKEGIKVTITENPENSSQPLIKIEKL